MSDLAGLVRSHTVVRMPGGAHAGAAPFVLLLVELDGGRRLLGHFAGDTPPAIGTRVAARPSGKVPVFSAVQATS